MSEFLRRKAAVPFVVLGCLTAGCGQGQSGGGEQPSVSSAPSAGASQESRYCADDLLPSYQIVGAKPDDHHAYLQTEKGTTCKTPIFNPVTMEKTGQFIEPDTQFWACVPTGDEPLHFEVTVIELQEFGAKGAVTLGKAATTQFLAANDVPACAP